MSRSSSPVIPPFDKSGRPSRSIKQLDYKLLATGKQQDRERSFQDHVSDGAVGGILSKSTPVSAKTIISDINDELFTLENEEQQLRLELELEEKRASVHSLKMKLRDIKSTSTTVPTSSNQLTSTTIQANFPGSSQRTTGNYVSDFMDPQIYLKTDTLVKKKYKKIINYIPKSRANDDREVKLADGVYIKTDQGSKTKVDSVSPSQWITANASILAEIIKEECQSPELLNMITDYLSYSAKIGELGGRFTWSTVMSYDDEYRDLQSRYGFRWGTDSSHMSTVILSPRDVKSSQSQRFTKNNNFTPQKNGKTCGYFNYDKKCPHEPNCKFNHVCELCGKDHSKLACNKSEHQVKTPGTSA